MGKQCKQWQTLFSWAPKSLQMVTAAMKLKDACSLEEKLWQHRQHIKKQRHYFANKGPPSHSYVFSSSMYWCESWTINKAECQRTDAFKLCCWRIVLKVPWTAKISNQLILKKISPEYSLKRLMLKLKLQSFNHLMQRAGSLEKTLMLGKIEDRRRRENRRWDCLVASQTQWTWIWASSRG